MTPYSRGSLKFFRYYGLFFLCSKSLHSLKLDLISVAGCLFPVALLNISQQLQIINKVDLSFIGMNINYYMACEIAHILLSVYFMVFSCFMYILLCEPI